MEDYEEQKIEVINIGEGQQITVNQNPQIQDEERLLQIKPQLHIEIPKVEKDYKTNHFQYYIKVQKIKIINGQKMVQYEKTVKRIFNEFHDLNNDLKSEGYLNIPKLPSKTIFQKNTKEDLQQRRLDLQTYLQTLIKNKEFLNSREVLWFLKIDVNFSELIAKSPNLIFSHQEKNGFSIKQTLFIPKFMLFVSVSNNIKQQQSSLKLFSFKNSSIIEDYFQIESQNNQPDQQGKNEQRYTEFQQVDTNDIDTDRMTKLPPMDQCEVEYLLDYKFTDLMITCCEYHKDSNILVVACSNGYIFNYIIDVQPCNEHLDNNNQNGIFVKRQSLLYDLQTKAQIINDKDISKFIDTEVFQKIYEQFEQKSPIYQVNQQNQKNNQKVVQFIRQNEENEDFNKQQNDKKSEKKIKYKIQISRHSIIQAHYNSIQKICLHQKKSLIYSMSQDKVIRISSLDVEEQKSIEKASIKISNMEAVTMELLEDVNRLYVSMKECVIYVFDIQEFTPIVIHTINSSFLITKLQFDPFNNILLCLDVRGSLTVLQMSTLNPKTHQKTIQIFGKYNDDSQEGYKMCDFQWLCRSHRGSNLNGTIIEGSFKGKLWVRDVNSQDGRFIKIPNNFTDKINHIQYNSEKNIVFVSCKDGKFKIWKLPMSWYE